MFDKLEDLLQRFEEIQNELSDPGVVNDQTRFRKLMKEQNDLNDIVEEYKRYKKTKQDIEDSLMMLDDEIGNLMTLELIAPDQRQAVRLSKLFERKAETVYSLIMAELLDDEDTVN